MTFEMQTFRDSTNPADSVEVKTVEMFGEVWLTVDEQSEEASATVMLTPKSAVAVAHAILAAAEAAAEATD